MRFYNTLLFLLFLLGSHSSNVLARDLDSALNADPYFATKLKMQLNQDKYSDVKKSYSNQFKAPVVKTRRQIKKEKLAALIAARPKSATPNPSTHSASLATKAPTRVIKGPQTPWRTSVHHQDFKSHIQHLGFKVKYDVKFDGMDKNWFYLLPKIRQAFGNFTPTITSGTDGRLHKKGTYSHYTGHKIDIRVKDIPGVKIRHNRIQSGRSTILEFVKKLNQIAGVKAVLEEKNTYPHIDILAEY